MTASFIADLEEIVYPSCSDDEDEDLFRIDSRRLLVGMFVARLDRPWTDTPLPQTGMLIGGDDELATVRKYCQHVMVDPTRSAEGMCDAIKAASVLSNDQTLTLADGQLFGGGTHAASREGSGAGAGDAQSGSHFSGARRGSPAAAAGVAADFAVPPRRNDVRPTNEARSQVRALLLAREGRASSDRGSAGPVARLRGWFGRDRSGVQPSTQVSARTLESLRTAWGSTIGAVVRDFHVPIRESLAVARPAHAKLVAAADAAVAQVRQGGVPAIASLVETAGAFVEALERAPDAMRWAGAMYRQGTPLPNPAMAVALRLAEFGRALGMPRESLHELVLIGLLSDIGKALLPRELLERPGVLAPQDYALVQQHVTIGLDLLSRSEPLPEAVLRGIAEHHERLDGSGYPKKSRADAIGLHGRMAGIADTFCGLTALRAYANPLSVEDGLSALHGWSGSLFDADLVEQFVLAIGVFPIGTLVELKSGEVAAVVDRSPAPNASPRLVVLTAADKGPLRSTRDRAGEQKPDQAYSGTQVRIARGLASGAYGLRLIDFYSRPTTVGDF